MNLSNHAWRALVFGLAAAGLLGSEAYAKPRVVILGFDGVEPTLVDSMMKAGQLPNLAKLKAQGSYQRLKSTNPPESPVAWSSFSTGENPGNHGVFDFLERDPSNYRPMIGYGDVEFPRYAPDGSVTKPIRFVSERKGEAFWVTADRQGARCTVLHVPFAFPPDPLEHGQMLCGLGVPDIRGLMTMAFFMSDSFTPEQLTKELSGSKRFPLHFDGDTAQVSIPGVQAAAPEGPPFVPVTFRIKADRQAHTVTVQIPGKDVTLAEHTWSDWLEWSIAVTPKYTVRAISRVYVLEVGAQVRVYMTCLQQHPRAPSLAFTTPPALSSGLAERYGLYKTIGWSFDTFAVRQDELPEDVFLDDVRQTSDWMARLTLDELDRGNFELLISAWTSTDRVAHLFWRFKDSKHPLYTEAGAKKYGHVIDDTYRQMDQIVGSVMGKLGREDLLLVLSDHGFHSFRTGFSVNTWLVRNGYLAVQGQPDAATAFNDRIFLDGYDWSKTKAYAVGLGGVYINLKGREAEGTVRKEDAAALVEEIRQKLLMVKAPGNNEKVFREVYTEGAFKGKAQDRAPDLQLAFADGYQTSKSSAKGAASAALFEANDDKWSGEHAASDVEDTPGILFSSKPLSADGGGPAIVDIGPTALRYLGLKPLPGLDGKALVVK